MGKLTMVKVRNAKAGVGVDGRSTKAVYQDGEGLFLHCAPTGAKSWILRVQTGGKRRDIGLGAVDVDGAGRGAFSECDNRLDETPLMLRKSLTLAEAREKAAALRKLAKAGADPVTERDRLRKAVPTFTEAMTEAHKALAAGWNAKTAKGFLSSLTEHATPKLGALKVDAIGSAEVIAALAPIWTDKPVMARKVRSRIGQVLAFAKARGWRSDALPDVREMRSGLSKQVEGGHFSAMPYKDCPKFFTEEWAKELTSSRAATLFALFTGNRSGSVRLAAWEQIDWETREWRCPADIMKKGRTHDIALSDAAIALIERYQPDKDMRKGLMFPGAKGGSLSDMSLTKVLRSAGRTETVHGWRSSFRDWAAEQMPHIPFLVGKLAISHKVGNATDQAYVRTQMLDMRRALFDGWGRFLAPSLSGMTDNVTAISTAKAG